MPANQISIQIKHKDPLISAGIEALLSAREPFYLSTPANDEAVPNDVVITDYDTGIAIARQKLAPNGWGPRVLILTHLEKEAQVRLALDSGIAGYLLHGCGADELSLAIIKLSRGQRYLSDAVTDWTVNDSAFVPLTLRETDVLNLLGRGCCNKIIAKELGIGVGTVKSHLKALMSKLNATARTHVVVLASQRGLIRLDA
jgi:DNA-binding NarL/FixJ family response regulator